MIDEKRYQLEMELHHGHITSLTSSEFVPQGAIAVVTSLECVEWLEEVVERLWLPDVGGKLPPYRGMPLIILALDKGKVGCIHLLTSLQILLQLPSCQTKALAH